MLRMEKEEEQRLIYAIALRVGTGKVLADSFGLSVPELRQFVADNHDRLLAVRERFAAPEDKPSSEPTPGQLSDLWITNKYQRLKRMQEAAEEMEGMIFNGGLSASELSTAVREFRSYMMLAANELGQLLHRGAGDAGDGSYLGVEISGVNMENLR